ncbi:MAG: acetyl-CoA carboxylase biotin carboxyl carrier protein subunit [Pedobacter sp.]|nr:MAG: acetyl-CoA carboxylase biotin carboxyl carrier protein subunit [Pedobacter sp.]
MKIKVNEGYTYEVEVGAEEIKINEVNAQIDARRLSSVHTHVLYQNRSYNVELVSENKDDKTSVLKVNGNLYHVSIEDQYDQLLKQLGMDTAMASKVKEIKAPMPGLVLSVISFEGVEVIKGDSILVLEAMKMENIIKSPADGKIKKVLVGKGDKVEKNQVLIQFE